MHISLINLKAFGDFVIACSAIKRIKSCEELILPKIVAGEHVRSLASALQLDQSVHFIGDESWKDVPAAFDVRKRGAYAAFKSILQIRRLLKDSPAETHFIFDKLGCRERFIGHGFRLHELSESDGNIYIAYDNFLKSLDFSVDMDFPLGGSIKTVTIIPGARMIHRVIPAQVISAFVSELNRCNIKTEIVVLEGEKIDLPVNINLRTIPRDFSVLIDVIRSSDLIISADSLPSHLSEFLRVPVFVSTPAPKPYWLPKSSYINNGWATFSNIRPFPDWLEENFNF
jgi:ADP-heptose:LPS heptosyltransferase